MGKKSDKLNKTKKVGYLPSTNTHAPGRPIRKREKKPIQIGHKTWIGNWSDIIRGLPLGREEE